MRQKKLNMTLAKNYDENNSDENQIIVSKTEIFSAIFSIVFIGLMVFGNYQKANAEIYSELDFGDSGSQVTELQQFLATDSSIYPEGLVTGYYGALTQAAVQKFQCKQNIVCSGTPETTGYGRVGPMTMSAIGTASPGNTGDGMAIGGADVYAPIISDFWFQKGRESANIGWATNEQARARVYYDTIPIRIRGTFDETGISNIEPTATGMRVEQTTPMRTFRFSLPNLNPNTTYYYVVMALDSENNSSLTAPSSFQTTP